ncbi:hypothetical protein [Actinokineospora enzanensis]|uniref:hypothetical protein n=1 Tax=Actinokineospora enzanensis TaxID=155975 RepID=UPI00035EB035|nr:hypothetical protein [Actinokineospora enzanensis]
MNPLWTVLDQAISAYQDSPRAAAYLHDLRDHLDAPLRIAITGPPGSGRSTLISAIVGDEVTGDVLLDWPGPVELTTTDGDATVHLLPHPGTPPETDPVTTVIALSRADELGGGRPDAVDSARRVAARHAATELGTRAQDVVAVAGLVALAGATLTRDEAAWLVALSRRPELESLLLSVDRLATVPGAPTILTRLGLFGVRLATSLIRRGRTDHLADDLVRASGIDDLRAAIGRCFVDRAPALRAHTTLSAIERVLRAEPRPAVATAVERLRAGTHEPRELRLLADLHTGRLTLGEDEDEARRLLGAHGTTPATRLAHSGDPYATLLHWRTLAEDPRLDSHQRRAALVVVRTCEALVTTGAVH